EGGAARVPAGSHLTISVTGGEGEPTLAIAGKPSPLRKLDALSFQADTDLAADGIVDLRRQGHALASWQLTVIPDRPPVVAWAEPPGRAPRTLQTRLPWRAGDDYGVTVLQAEMRLQARPHAPPLTVAIPVPATAAREAHGVSLQDFTSHPWAGLEVTARLVARDAAGQTATSEDARFTLPERPFENPAARALVAARKSLSLDPDDRDPAIGAVNDLLQHPELLGDDSAAFLNLAAISALLVRERGADAVPEAQARMWDLALHLEEGAAELTARALERAREAVREAMDRATQSPSDQASKDLEERLKQLEDAIQRHMEALAEQARRENAVAPNDPNAPQLSSRDLQRMAEEAREAARAGKLDEARRRMAELEQMLDRLRNGRPMRGGEQRRNAEQRQKARQGQSALQDMVGREGGLLDHAQGRQNGAEQPSAGRTPPSRAKPNAGREANGGDPAAQREADRRVQQALRRALGELMQQFGDATGQVPPSLGEAESAMREAGEALANGQDEQAGSAQGRAIEALQKGGQQMAEAMAKQFGPGQPGEAEGDDGDPGGTTGFSLQDGRSDGEDGSQGTIPGQRGRQGRRDPLGRQVGQGTSGADEGSDVKVPEEMERQRGRAIQEELRRRGADRARPQQELDYIDRLLKPF
ncbi:MAG: DUF4175 family protein, partial [Acetobacteraceae bacterium]|nr:DUF4175 family protein [Acetobacteraceae bacterium]